MDFFEKKIFECFKPFICDDRKRKNAGSDNRQAALSETGKFSLNIVFYLPDLTQPQS